MSEGPTRARSLGDTSRQILRAICDTFLPAGGCFPEGAENLELARRIEGHFAGMGPGGPRLAALLLRWIDLQPLLFELRPRRFRTLPLRERTRTLDRMERSRLPLRRQPLLTLKLLLSVHAYADAGVAERIGHDRAYLSGKLREAEERRQRGGKGPYPTPEPPPRSPGA
ncbi:MAG: hypothetical protein ACE5FG_05675 [Myxococcota bacterium]